MPINTEKYSAWLRERSIDVHSRSLLLSDLRGSQQECDLSEPVNCDGIGRIRHFRRHTSPGWPTNPLPIDPVCRALSLPRTDILRAQAFQNASCNWRCWYCFVDFKLLAADPRYSQWVTPEELVRRHQAEPNPPSVLDLSGGQPDLIPEWVPWTLDAIRSVGLENKLYVWSDDNLSNEYFWTVLSDAQREIVAQFRNYGRVCCFKGFDEESFAFNTAATPDRFHPQFSLFQRLKEFGIDLYAYVTLTSPSSISIRDGVRAFVDKLQNISPNLPLRTVPLEISVFTPVESRMNDVRHASITNQWRAIEIWSEELEKRFSASERTRDISTVPL